MFSRISNYILTTILCAIASASMAQNWNFGNYASESDYLRCVNCYLLGNYESCIEIADSFYVNTNFKSFTYSKYANTYSTRMFAYAALSSLALAESSENSKKMVSLEGLHYATIALRSFDNILYDKDIEKYGFTNAEHEYEYLTDIGLAECCAQILIDSHYGSEKWANKIIKKHLKSAYKSTYLDRGKWNRFPAFQLEILNIALDYFCANNDVSALRKSNFVDEYWNNINRVVKLSEESNNFNYSLLSRSDVVDNGTKLFLLTRKNKSENLSPLVLDYMLKQRDMTLYINGCKKYKDFINTSWQTVKSQLDDNEYAMETFEGPILAGMYYSRDDITSRTINYAFVFNNKSLYPEFWIRGRRDGVEKQGFQAYDQAFPNMKMLYTTCTDEMIIKDIIGDNPKIAKVHSLSHLNDGSNNTIEGKRIVMFADIEYDDAPLNTNKALSKGAANDALPRIDNDKKSVVVMESLFPNTLKLFSGNSATVHTFYTKVKNADILHVSTHGIYDQAEISQLNATNLLGIANGFNVLKSCKIAFAGYNNDTANSISALDIKNMDLSHLDLVFLDACETNAGKTLSGGAYSMAESFHMAGVKNIIANIDPIRPDIATNFVENFYTMLKNGATYHDAFYKTKAKVCPNQRIIFWE